MFSGRACQGGQQSPPLFVGPGAGHDGDVEALDLVDLLEVDFRENQLFANPQRVVAPAVETTGGNPLEVTDARKSDVDQAIKELIGALAAEGHHAADGHPLTQLESGDRALGLGNDGLLTGNPGELVDSRLQNLDILDASPNPILITTFSTRGTSIALASCNSCLS